jgi:RNA-directed DNA polymerase
LGERPHTGTEETVEPQDPETSQARQGKKKQVHSLIDKVFSRKNRELAWEKVKKNRGSAGIDDVTIAPLEARQEGDLDLRHRKRRAGTYRPQPVTRVEIPKSAGGVRKLGIPTVLDRVCQQALVQRMEPIFEPTVLDSAFGYRRGRSPHDARRQGWGELHKGNVGLVDADLRQCFDTIDQERRIDVIAEASSDGRVLQRVRDVLRAGVMEGGCWKPTLTGVPQGGVASPLWSNSFLTPFDRQMTAEGFRLTRWADDFVVRCQTRAEAQRALAVAERCLREALGVERHPQKTRVVHVSQGVEFLG